MKDKLDAIRQSLDEIDHREASETGVVVLREFSALDCPA